MLVKDARGLGFDGISRGYERPVQRGGGVCVGGEENDVSISERVVGARGGGNENGLLLLKDARRLRFDDVHRFSPGVDEVVTAKGQPADSQPERGPVDLVVAVDLVLESAEDLLDEANHRSVVFGEKNVIL